MEDKIRHIIDIVVHFVADRPYIYYPIFALIVIYFIREFINSMRRH